jgi:hypothetical protein
MTALEDVFAGTAAGVPVLQESLNPNNDHISSIKTSEMREPAPQNGESKAHEQTTSFHLVDQWHSQPRKLRIIHVGAGATGLCAAFKMERQLTDYELVCYEKNHEVGGTWLQNRYPGCACDVPAHIYTYTFEPNAKWESYYAYAPSIQDYFVSFCDKYNLRKYVKLQHKVTAAVWHEDKAQWEVTVEHAGKIFTDWCHILVNGSGLLNSWRCKHLPSPSSHNDKEN